MMLCIEISAFLKYSKLCSVVAMVMTSDTSISHGKGEGHVVHAGVNCVCNVCGSAHSCGCVVNGSFARAAF